MIRNFGTTELLIILLIVVLIFGVGRFKEIGSAIREFRKGIKGDDEGEKEPEKKSEAKKS